MHLLSTPHAQVNSTFRAYWLTSSEVISQVLFTSEQPKKNKIAFVDILSQIKSLFGPLVIQLVWYMLQQLFTSVSWIIVKYTLFMKNWKMMRDTIKTLEKLLKVSMNKQWFFFKQKKGSARDVYTFFNVHWHF